MAESSVRDFTSVTNTCNTLDAEDFLARRKANDEAHAAAKKAGKKIVTKRAPVGLPREGFTLENVKTEILTPIPYDIVREGVQL